MEVVFRETTSSGVRKFKVGKVMLHRKFSTVKTKYGDVTLKNSYYEGEQVKYKAEYENCQKIARENNISLIKVYREVDIAVEKNAHLTSPDVSVPSSSLRDSF